MQLSIYKDYQELSEHTADAILATVKDNPDAVCCFATGDSPRLAYQLMVKRALEEKTDLSCCTFIGLDEWVGVPPENEGSCRFFLENLLFKPLHIQPSQIHLFDAMAPDLAGECIKMDNAIAATAGIDLMIVGIGMNGHVGFNEPGVSPDLYAHVISLDEITLSVGQKYFSQPATLRQGITLGLKHIMQSKNLLLLANGAKKAEVIQKTLEGVINNEVPASILRTHPRVRAIIDEQAAAALLNLLNFPLLTP